MDLSAVRSWAEAQIPVARNKGELRHVRAYEDLAQAARRLHLLGEPLGCTCGDPLHAAVKAEV